MYIYVCVYIYIYIHIFNPGGNISQKNSCTATYNLFRKPSTLDKQDMRDTP